MLFLVQHWLFTAQYLKAALNFELAFSIKTGEVEKKNNSRKWLLIALHVGAYFSFFVSSIALFVKQNRLTLSIIYTVQTLGITLLLTYSIRKLNKCSKILVKNGFSASRVLIKVHLWAFWVSSIL